MARTLTAPKYPEDFKSLHADGGFYYQHWHPDAPADYDGTWPSDQDPPPWSGGLWVLPDANYESIVVVWEFSPETESGPTEEVPTIAADSSYGVCEAEPGLIQAAVERVIAEVNRQASFA